jgi:hypothetical protein
VWSIQRVGAIKGIRLMAQAPQKFADWMSSNKHQDPKYGHVYRYHSRSDSHSKALCVFILEDLLETCPVMKNHAAEGRLVYGVNVKYTWPKTGKKKTIDLAMGNPIGGPVTRILNEAITEAPIERVLISCEAKTVMTEHGKSQPRIFDELGSSHEIVHQGDIDAIAAGVTVVNIADQFASPLRQKMGEGIVWTRHKQPHAAQKMIQHLRGLPIRTTRRAAGFDAYSTIVVSCDNQAPCTFWTGIPAPQTGDADYYGTFVERISSAYSERFGK